MQRLQSGPTGFTVKKCTEAGSAFPTLAKRPKTRRVRIALCSRDDWPAKHFPVPRRLWLAGGAGCVGDSRGVLGHRGQRVQSTGTGRHVTKERFSVEEPPPPASCPNQAREKRAIPTQSWKGLSHPLQARLPCRSPASPGQHSAGCGCLSLSPCLVFHLHPELLREAKYRATERTTSSFVF